MKWYAVLGISAGTSVVAIGTFEWLRRNGVRPWDWLPTWGTSVEGHDATVEEEMETEQ